MVLQATGHIGLNTPESYKKAPMEMFRVTVADDGKGIEGFKKRLEYAYLFGFLQTKGIDINPIRDLFVKDIIDMEIKDDDIRLQ